MPDNTGSTVEKIRKVMQEYFENVTPEHFAQDVREACSSCPSPEEETDLVQFLKQTDPPER